MHGVDQRGLLAADECACTVTEFYIEIEISSEDVVAQKSIFPGLLDGDLETMDGQRIFSADIDESVFSSYAVSADGHCLKDAVRVSLENGTVHGVT